MIIKENSCVFRVNGGAFVTTRAQVGLKCGAEYEAPTRTEPLDGPPGTAKYVHEVLSTVRAPTLNTDPWIFHPGFVWTTCRQLKADGVRTGDLVLFGSALEGHWVTDTVSPLTIV